MQTKNKEFTKMIVAWLLEQGHPVPGIKDGGRVSIKPQTVQGRRAVGQLLEKIWAHEPDHIEAGVYVEARVELTDRPIEVPVIVARVKDGRLDFWGTKKVVMPISDTSDESFIVISSVTLGELMIGFFQDREVTGKDAGVISLTFIIKGRWHHADNDPSLIEVII